MTIVEVLEKIARFAKKGDAALTRDAIETAKEIIRGRKDLAQLYDELSTWQDKLDVILKEPAGKQGMAKHALHWAEQIKKQ